MRPRPITATAAGRGPEPRASLHALPAPHADVRAWLQALPVAAFTVARGRIAQVNEAAVELFGLPSRALVGHSPLELFDPASLARDRLRRVLHTRTSGHASRARTQPGALERILRGDGSLRVVQLASAPLPGPGRLQQLVLVHDLTEITMAQAELQRSQAQLRRLSSGMTAAQEQERRRVAHALHDELQQALAAIRMNLGAATQAAEQAGGAPATLQHLLAEADSLAASGVAATRRIVDTLLPPMLEELGLVPALQTLAARFGQRTGVSCHFEQRGRPEDDVAPALATITGLYRVAQEALENVARHAGASSVTLELQHLPAGGQRLSVRDNGVGMALDPHEYALGLPGLQERLRALGGQLRVNSARGLGTVVTAEIAGPQAAAPSAAPQEPKAAQDDGYAALLRFLYRTPVGLVQAGLDGRIEMLNPVAAQWLLPLCADGALDNLFQDLADVLPQLPALVAAVAGPSGVVCEGLVLGAPVQGGRRLTLSLFKQDGTHLMAVLIEMPAEAGAADAGAAASSRA